MAKSAGEDFPDDSFFRNSNVAILDAAIQEKKTTNLHEESAHTIEPIKECKSK